MAWSCAQPAATRSPCPAPALCSQAAQAQGAQPRHEAATAPCQTAFAVTHQQQRTAATTISSPTTRSNPLPPSQESVAQTGVLSGPEGPGSGQASPTGGQRKPSRGRKLFVFASFLHAVQVWPLVAELTDCRSLGRPLRSLRTRRKATSRKLTGRPCWACNGAGPSLNAVRPLSPLTPGARAYRHIHPRRCRFAVWVWNILAGYDGGKICSSLLVARPVAPAPPRLCPSAPTQQSRLGSVSTRAELIGLGIPCLCSARPRTTIAQRSGTLGEEVYVTNGTRPRRRGNH